MCLHLRAKILGAKVLPFGMTTDVSAGALVAGSGGALGNGASGLVSADTTSGPHSDVFAKELETAAGQGAEAALDGDAFMKAGPVNPVPADGAAQGTVDLPKAAANDPIVVGPALHPASPVLPASVPQAVSGRAAVTPSVAESELLEAIGPDAALLDEQAADVAMVVSAQVSPVPVPFLVSAGGGAGTPAARPAGMDPAMAGLSADGVAGRKVPGAPGGLMPGSPGATGPNGTNDLQQSAAAGAGGSAQPVAAGAGGQAAASTGRRWQNELPPELRAPGPEAGQGRGAGAVAVTPQAVAGPGTSPAVSSLNGSETAVVQQAVTKQTAGAALPVLPGQTNTAPAQTGPTGGVPAAMPTLETTAAAGQVAASRSAVTPGVASVTASAVTASPAPVQPLTQTTELPVTTPAGGPLQFEPVPETVAGAFKPGLDGNASPAAAKPAGTTAQAGHEPVTRPAGAQSVAAPVGLAAAAAVAVPVEDAELPLSSLEAGSGSEFTSASVRGGDLHGAMRTESLQTPNQSQSAHVATQVAAEIARNLKNGHTHFQMRFDPPELGRVEVNMRVGADGTVQAHLIVDRPETLDMFLRDQRGLERALEAAGLSPDSDNLQFSLKQDGGQDFASERGDGNEQSGFDDGGADGTAEPDPDLTDTVRLMLAEQRGGLDMKV